MAGSSMGTIFKITTWGESHGAGIGVVIDGCPAGLSLSEKEIQDVYKRQAVPVSFHRKLLYISSGRQYQKMCIRDRFRNIYTFSANLSSTL